MSSFFKMEDFECGCNLASCKSSNQFMNENFLDALFKIRAQVDFDMPILSAFRCKAHNKSVGGLTNSPFTRGTAVMIGVQSPVERYELIEQIVYHGLSFGLYDSHIYIELKNGIPQAFCDIKD